MTKEEAIEILKYIKHVGNGESEYVGCAQEIALDMAIKALEQEYNTMKHSFNLYDYDQREFLKNGNIQQVIWMEELAELQQAISKSLRGKLDRYNMIEEVADVLICLTQLRIEYAIDDHELQSMIDYKHRRNIARQSQQQERVYKDENLID